MTLFDVNEALEFKKQTVLSFIASFPRETCTERRLIQLLNEARPVSRPLSSHINMTYKKKGH